jgi:peptidoglycan glycosyltransferase
VNAPMRRVAVACLVLFAALLANASWVQVGQAKRLDHSATNPRPLFQRFSRDRGNIVLADGAVIASSVPDGPDGKTYRRQYAASDPAEYAALTGWAGVSSTTGLEKAEDDLLTGNDDRLAVRNFVDVFSNRPQQGGYVTTTIDHRTQDAAWAALRAAGPNVHGAVVALDVATGAVLALVSTPSFDPTPLAARDPKVVGAAYQQLVKDGGMPLLDRATQGHYPPGSFFKVVTSAAALGAGRTPDTPIAAPDLLSLPLTTAKLSNFGGESCGGPQIPLRQALKISCNTAFGRLGLDLGADALRRQAAAFGVGSTVDGFPLPQEKSTFPETVNAPNLAFSAIGQYDDAFSPLQAAMIVQAVAHQGSELAPYLVAQEHAPDGSMLSQAVPRELGKPVTPQVAAQLTQMMQAVTSQPGGTAFGFIQRTLGGVTSAGKTGTAQHGTGAQPPHAWFAGFAPVESPRIAVAVIVEDGGRSGSDATGGAVAAPIAGAVMKAYVCGHPPRPAGC